MQSFSSDCFIVWGMCFKFYVYFELQMTQRLETYFEHVIKRQWAQTKTQNVPLEHEETVAQVAQEGYRLSILGDIQKTSGHGPGQPALGSPAWVISKGPFQPQLFCDSVTQSLTNLYRTKSDKLYEKFQLPQVKSHKCIDSNYKNALNFIHCEY